MSLFSKGPLCKRCSTPFSFRDFHLGQRSHLGSHIPKKTPILLSCGHNICESCAGSLLKTRREIPCPHCEAITTCQPGETNVEYLPIDKYTLGSVLLQKKLWNKPRYVMQIPIPNLQAENLLNASQEKCTDCDEYTATLYCVNCISNMCHDCFIKAHKDSISLGRHKVQPIEKERKPNKSVVCEFHNEILEFFCNDDDMKVCKSCLQPNGKHCSHDVIQLAEKNKDAMEEVLRGGEHVKNMCTHLFIAGKRLKDYLPKVKTKSQAETDKIQNAFMHAHGLLQIRESTLENAVTLDVEDSEKSIEHLLEEIEATSKQLKGFLCDIESCKADKSLSKVDDIVAEMNSVKELPCHIEDIALENESRVQFDETSMSHLKDFGTILNLDDDRWKLCTIKEGARPQGISEDELQNAEKNSVPAVKMATMSAQAYIETHTSNTEVTEVMPARKTFSESPVSDYGNRLQFKRRHEFGGSTSCISEFNHVPYTPLQRSPTSPPRPAKWKYLQQEQVILSHSNNPSNFWVRLSSKSDIFRCFHKEIEDYMWRTNEPCPEADVVKGQMYLAQREKDNRWCRVRVQDIIAASLVMKPSVADKVAHVEKAAAENEEMNDRGDGDSDATVEFNAALIEATPPQEPAQPECESGLAVKVFHIDFGSSEMIPISGLRKIPRKFSEHAEFVIHCALAEIEGIHGFWTPDANAFFECYCGQGTVMMTVIHTSDIKVEVELDHLPRDKFNDTPGSARETLVFHELAKYTCDSPKFLDRTKIKKYYHKTELPGLGTNSNVTVHCVNSPEDIYVQQEGCEHDRFVKMMATMNTFYENLADVDSWIVYNPKIGMPCIAKCENDIWNRAVIENLPGHLQLDVVFVDFGNTKRIMSSMARRMNSHFMRLPTHAVHCGLVDIKPKSGIWSEEARTNLTQLVDGKVFRMTVIGISDDKLDVCLLQHIPEYKQVVSLSSQLVKLGHAISSGNSSDRVILSYKQELGIIAKNKDSTCPSDYIPVTVCFVKDPSEIYVQCDERKDRLEEMVTKLQDFYSESQSTVTSDHKWEIGQQCVVRNQFKWFRCVIKQMKFANLFEVWAMDYGHCIDATRENMRLMEEDFQDDHAFACKCHLANISPTGGNNKWTASAVNYVKERFDSNPNVFLRVDGPTVEDSEPVDLYVKKIDFGGALEPTKILYVSTRNDIMEAGFAIPRRRIKAEPGTEPVVAIPVVLQKQVIVKAEPQKKVENWLPPVQPNRAHWKCTVIPTRVDEDGIIYLHNEDEVDQIKLIKSAMASKYENAAPEQDDICWSKDECCAASVHLDDIWHRGRVVDVKPEGIEVFFIDYGYCEILTAEHLRKEIIFTNVPQLCWPCKLYGIEPKTDDATWPETTIEFVSQTILNQRSEMEVWIPPKDKDLMEITLKLPSNEDLGQLLISKDYVFFLEPCTDCVPEDMDTTNGETSNAEVPRADVMFNAFPELMLPPVGEMFLIVAVDVGATPDMFLMQRAYMETPQTEYQQQAKEHYLFAANMCATLNEKAPFWPVVENVQPGTPCCTMYSLDGRWFRAVVQRLQEASMCLVLFVDYGNEEIVSMKDIKVLPKEFLDFPRQCICCKLHQIVPASEEEGWTEDVVQKFHTLWSDPPPMLLAEVKVSRYPIEVDIVCYDQDGNDSLAYQNFIDMGLVRQC